MDDLDLNPLFVQADPGKNKKYCEKSIINEVPDTLDQKIWPEIESLINRKLPLENVYSIENTDRAVGTRISYNLYKKFGNNKLGENTFAINFKGSAGQSFGAFGVKAVSYTHLTLPTKA